MASQLNSRIFADIQAFIDEHFVADESFEALDLSEAVLGEDAVGAPFFAPSCGAAPASLADEADLECADATPTEQAPVAQAPVAQAPHFLNSIKSLPSTLKNRFARAESIDDLLKQKQATFSEALLQEIDAQNLSDPEVYKRAFVDRKLFSKIRSNAQYQPKKPTALALTLALHMSLDDTLDLLGRAGYTLSPSSKADLIVMYFIDHDCWDINLINQALYEFDQPLIGC